MIIVIKVRIEILLYSRKLFKISFFIIIGKNFNSLLNLFQIYGPKNGMLFWAKLLFVKGVSKAKCDLVLYVFLKVTKSSFT